MHLIQALYLWSMVSALILGGALMFARFFPEESPWFGLLVPPLALVALLNFSEHVVALPDLILLLPVMAVALGWLAVTSRTPRGPLLLPAAIFLASFAFTYAIRCLQPDILPTSDGLSDLNKINNYCQGDTLPPIDTWMPPFHYVWYYSWQHYAASIVKRLLHLDLGTAYNLSHALLSALTCTAGAAAAHRLARGNMWITAAIPFLIESAATGSSALIQLTTAHPNLWLANNISGGVLNPPDDHFLWRWLALDPNRERLELQVPGFWTWRDEYHANMAGHFLTLFGVLIVAELAVARRTLWPWLLALLLPLLAVVSSTWAYPILSLLCGGMLLIVLALGRRPKSFAALGVMLAVSLLLFWPGFFDVTSSPQVPDLMWTRPEWRVAWREFLLQWWPILLLWLWTLAHVRSVGPSTRWVLIVAPLMLTGVEILTVESRYNTVEKMWGYTFGAALIAFFPAVALAAGQNIRKLTRPEGTTRTLRILASVLSARVLVSVLLFSAAVSLIMGWIGNTVRWAPWKDGVFHLEGNHYLTSDATKDRLLQIFRQTKHATYLSGKCIWCYNEAPALAVFTGNRSYIAWSYFESVADYPGEAQLREKLNNDFYAGTMADPLHFLEANHITGVLIWPDDNIPNDLLERLKTALAPAYEFIDCRGDGSSNAGVFLKPAATN